MRALVRASRGPERSLRKIFYASRHDNAFTIAAGSRTDLALTPLRARFFRLKSHGSIRRRRSSRDFLALNAHFTRFHIKFMSVKSAENYWDLWGKGEKTTLVERAKTNVGLRRKCRFKTTKKRRRRHVNTPFRVFIGFIQGGLNLCTFFVGFFGVVRVADVLRFN